MSGSVDCKLKQVDMQRLEVGSKGLRANVPHERERCRSFWKGRYHGEMMEKD